VHIFLAGATGAIGRFLTPMLVAAGHTVHGTTRRPDRASWLRSVGAEPVVLDAGDRAAVERAIVAIRPDAILHQLTDLAAGFGPDALQANARLRQVATLNLVDAALAAGTRLIVAQSGAWAYAEGPLPHTEDDPLRDPATHPDDLTLPGILELERLVLGTAGLDGVVLRYGFFYGPGTVSDEPADPPSVHVAAAARAAVLALERAGSGAVNVVDDGPLVSNRRARDELGWSPDMRA
jgi:nucleoside-diphosphate-sugar epimerase